jgi:outer membrane protein assembly factor BamB
VLLAALVLQACPLHAAEDAETPCFALASEPFGPVYRVDRGKVRSAADLATVPGVKIAWNVGERGAEGLLANARDVDGDGKVDLFSATRGKKGCYLVRHDEGGRQVWASELFNPGMGSESGLALEDLDGDGTFELVFNVYRQLWCMDANTGKTNWKIDLPHCKDNHQNSMVGHFLDRKRFAVVCRVFQDVTCYDAAGKKVWTYRLDDKKSTYGHEMSWHDGDGDGLDEVYLSLHGALLALGGDGKVRWSDTGVGHSDFIHCGDVDGDGDREIVYDRYGCSSMRGPIVCADARTGKVVRTWTYARPGKDHLQRAVLGDFDASRPGVELAAVGKNERRGGLMVWGPGGGPAWQRAIPARWVAMGDWNGDGALEIMPCINGKHGDGWEVWTGKGKRLYAVTGLGGMPLGTDSGGREHPDLDGNGRADVLVYAGDGYVALMEMPEAGKAKSQRPTLNAQHPTSK